MKPAPNIGFILVATLWALFALAAIAAYIDRLTTANVDNARQEKLMLQGELDRRSTEATLLYLLATNPMSYRSLVIHREQTLNYSDGNLPRGFGDGEVRIAGEVYEGFGGVRFSLQDETGLVSVNMPYEAMLPALLEHVGVPADETERLMPRVRDYIDIDETLTLNGAERFDYLRAGKPEPADWLFASVMEFDRVLGTDNLIGGAALRRLRSMATPRLVPGFNFNTSPPEVAAAVLGIGPDALAPLLEARAEGPVTDLDRIAALTGQYPSLDPDRVLAYPMRAFRLSTWWRGGGPRSVVGVSLTPGSYIAPWRKEYRYSEPVDAETGTPRQPETELLGGQPPERT